MTKRKEHDEHSRVFVWLPKKSICAKGYARWAQKLRMPKDFWHNGLLKPSNYNDECIYIDYIEL